MQQHHDGAALQQPATTFAGEDHSWCLNSACLESIQVGICSCVHSSKLTKYVFTCSSEDTVVPARGRKLVKTGIAIHIPVGTYGRVAPRSGLAVNHFIDVGAGVIDEDYRGEVRVLLFNHEDKDFTGGVEGVTLLLLHYSTCCCYQPPHRNITSHQRLNLLANRQCKLQFFCKEHKPCTRLSIGDCQSSLVMLIDTTNMQFSPGSLLLPLPLL